MWGKFETISTVLHTETLMYAIVFAIYICFIYNNAIITIFLYNCRMAFVNNINIGLHITSVYHLISCDVTV